MANAGTFECTRQLKELVVSPELVHSLDLVPSDTEFANKVLGNFWRHVWEKDTRRAIVKLKTIQNSYGYWTQNSPAFLESRGIATVFDLANYSLEELAVLLLRKKDVSENEIRLAAKVLKSVRIFLLTHHLTLQREMGDDWMVRNEMRQNEKSLSSLNEVFALLSPEHRNKLFVFEEAAPLLRTVGEFSDLIAEVSAAISIPSVARPILTAPFYVEHWCFGGQEVSVWNTYELQDAINLDAIGGPSGLKAPIKTIALGSALSYGPSFQETDFLFWHIRGFEEIQAKRKTLLKSDSSLRVHLLQNSMFSNDRPHPTLMQYQGRSQQTLELLLLEGIRRGQVKLAE